jgi:hypothetical protein
MAEPQKDPFSFLDNLDEKQQAFASEIIEKSKKLGLDPRLGLALTYRESKFDPAAIGTSGEIGLMQIMPSTGKLLGYTEKDLKNPSRNIDAGLQYLNQNMIKFNDPVLAVAGYNAGPDHPYFSDPKIPLPDSTIGYLKDIKNLGGFTTSPKEEDTSSTGSSAGSSDGAPPAPPVPASPEDLRKQKAAMIGGLGGFGVGATQTIAGGGSQAPTTTANTPGGRYAAKTGYGLGEGSTKEVIERYKKFAPRDLGEQMFAGDAKKTSMGAGPRSLQVVPGTQAPLSINAKVPPTPPTPVLQQVRQGMQTAGNAMGRMPVVPGVLGGANTGFQGQEAFSRYQKGDMPGTAIAGVGALGGLASMVPHPATRALGATASTVSPAALAVLDKLRTMNQAPATPATQGEMRSAQNPAFMYPRP